MMSDRPFYIFWNELSFVNQNTDLSAAEAHAWRERALDAFKALQSMLVLRGDCRILIVQGLLKSKLAERPLQSWLVDWLGKDRYRKLLGKLIPAPIPGPHLDSIHELDCELSCCGILGEGLTRAHIFESWTWSIGSEEAACSHNVVEADKTLIHSSTIEKVNVRNIASADHVAHWSSELEAWGSVIAASSIVAKVGEYQIIMYPSDHWPPHIHVRQVGNPILNIKFRIDQFEDLTEDRQRPDGLESEIKGWVGLNREKLLISWSRCERGELPLKL